MKGKGLFRRTQCNIMEEGRVNRFNIEVVITSYNQGEMILEALNTVYSQTLLPKRIFIVDDGSTDEDSLNVLNMIERMDTIVPMVIYRQENAGVSAARNKGISLTEEDYVLVFDGDDRLKESYIEEVAQLITNDERFVAASAWMQTFGVLEAVVKPMGGNIVPFLARNCCPATHILKRAAWEECGGYDETMRNGFEDWDFFLSMLETRVDAKIGIVPKPLMEYRTAPASANVKSMSKRMELMRYIIGRHKKAYCANMIDALLGIEQTSMERLSMWEQEILNYGMSEVSKAFMESPTYGDGGMAAAVRVATQKGKK